MRPTGIGAPYVWCVRVGAVCGVESPALVVRGAASAWENPMDREEVLISSLMDWLNASPCQAIGFDEFPEGSVFGTGENRYEYDLGEYIAQSQAYGLGGRTVKVLRRDSAIVLRYYSGEGTFSTGRGIDGDVSIIPQKYVSAVEVAEQAEDARMSAAAAADNMARYGRALQRGTWMPGVQAHLESGYSLGVNPLKGLRRRYGGTWKYYADALLLDVEGADALWAEQVVNGGPRGWAVILRRG